jgi:hypothetical protein
MHDKTERERERARAKERESEKELYYELSMTGGPGRRPRTDSASPRYGIPPHKSTNTQLAAYMVLTFPGGDKAEEEGRILPSFGGGFIIQRYYRGTQDACGQARAHYSSHSDESEGCSPVSGDLAVFGCNALGGHGSVLRRPEPLVLAAAAESTAVSPGEGAGGAHEAQAAKVAFDAEHVAIVTCCGRLFTSV